MKKGHKNDTIKILENLGIHFLRWFKSKTDIGDRNWGDDKPSKADNKVDYLIFFLIISI